MNNKVKIMIAIIIVVVLFGLSYLWIFGDKITREVKEYYTNDLSFKSNVILEEKEKGDFDLYFENLTNNVIILGVKDTPKEKVSLEEYSSEIYDQKSESALTDLKKSENGFYYFTYNYEEGGVFYLRAIYDNNDDFWVISFACEINDQKKYEKDFLEWASSVKFN